MGVDLVRAENAMAEFLQAVGVEENEHTAGTPARVAKWWKEFIDYDPGTIDRIFPIHENNSGMIVSVLDMRVWSVCAHHLLPFWCDVDVAYVPKNGAVLGLSKFARIAHQHAHKPTTQEQLVNSIVEHVEVATGSEDVAVRARGEHLCMTMRGIKTPGRMTTTEVRGLFRKPSTIRDEWLATISR